jgi:hypothetical protein
MYVGVCVEFEVEKRHLVQPCAVSAHASKLLFADKVRTAVRLKFAERVRGVPTRVALPSLADVASDLGDEKWLRVEG